MATTINVKIAPLPRGDWSDSATYAKLDVVSYNGSSYMAIQAVSAGTLPTNTTYWQLLAEQPTITDGSITTAKIADGAVTQEKLADGLDFAKQDGYYEDMSVGSAEQLISSVYVNDKVPYVFRTSGGSADIGDRDFEDAIVGGSVAFNQLMKTLSSTNYYNGIAYTVTYGTNEATVSGVTATWQGVSLSQQTTVLSGHKYLVSVDAKMVTASQSVRLGTNLFGVATVGDYLTTTSYVNCATIGNVTTTQSLNVSIGNRNGTYDYVLKNFMLIDLTQMFGSTIADYIYSLEQGEAGAGVAWFRALFPKPYYAYNAGALIHVNASSHNTIGFNQWDEEWENGVIDVDTGQDSPLDACIRSKNYVPVVPNTTYYITEHTYVYGIFFYSADKSYIGYTTLSTATFSVPSNCSFIRFRCLSTYGATYKNDICINLSWDGERNGEYEPYVKHTYALDSDLTLRGIPKIDANNKLYYDGDTYSGSGTVTRRFGIVDLGTLTWTHRTDAGTGLFATTLTGRKFGQYVDAICDKYTYAGTVTAVGGAILKGNKTISFYWINDIPNYSIYIYDTAYSNITSFQSAMNGVYLAYELATPTTETADAFTSPQIIDDFGTEEFVVTEQSGVAMHVGHESRYTSNLRAKLEMMPNSPDSNGLWLVQHNNGMNTYVQYIDKLPIVPNTDATYILKATVSGGVATLSWVEET